MPNSNGPNPQAPFSPEAFDELRADVARLSSRVDTLELQLATLASPAPLNAPIVPALNTKSRLETKYGLTLVTRAGAVTLAIGIIFFFKYAADNRWIGAEGRVAVGVIISIAMLAAGEWQSRRSSNNADAGILTQGIAGCGLAILYVALYAAVGYYELIVPAAGWALLVIVSLLAMFLSVRYLSAVIAALGLVGALLTPMLLHNAATAWWFDFCYLLAISTGALLLALRQGWSALIPCSAALSCLAAAVVLDHHHPGWFILFALALSFAHFLGARGQRNANRAAEFAYVTAHGCLLIGLGRAVALWARGQAPPGNRFTFISALESVLLGGYGTALLLAGLARKSNVNRTIGFFLLACVIVKLYLLDVWQFDRSYRISAFVALGVLLLAASYLYSRFRTRIS